MSSNAYVKNGIFDRSLPIVYKLFESFNVGSGVGVSSNVYNWCFYDFCFALVNWALQQIVNETISLQYMFTIFNYVIDFEKFLFNQSKMLNFLLNYFIENSDGDSFRCVLYTRILEMLLCKYQEINSR
ncbi:ac19-like protein [Malacosoma neustria nucleopolyhedrovirus]|uniref:ac19-like protein n=1 Tax=Malacosoma neustria nuclear polyhedrosis virus TaxID=38012 RepID=UPI000E35F75E|nr:ac19-like protein [Malacosoma neustria nucleopolyhedrovirus]AUF81640.1 ac19-like protein [Malacosoma neustria nucleopolyhedrovirus]